MYLTLRLKLTSANDDTQFDTNGVQFVINPNDEFGLTRAMWFKEKQGSQCYCCQCWGGGPTLSQH